MLRLVILLMKKLDFIKFKVILFPFLVSELVTNCLWKKYCEPATAEVFFAVHPLKNAKCLVCISGVAVLKPMR